MTSKALTIISLLLVFLSFRVIAQTPSRPRNLSAEVESDTKVELEWRDRSNNEDLFIVERSVENQNNFVIIGTTSRNTETYTDQSAEPKTAYFYRVKARNITFFGNRDSGYSNVVNVTTPGRPDSPTGLNAMAKSRTSIEITWQKGSDDTEEYRIERSKNNNHSFTFVANVNVGEETYVDNGLTSNTRYYYRVRAFNDYGSSSFSNRDSDITFQFPPTLNAIPNPDPILENSGQQTINLRGITAGGEESQKLTIRASSNNKDLIPDPTVNYNSPNRNGTLSYTPVSGKFGSATITVTVEDDGRHNPPDNVNRLSRTFTVVVQQALPDFVVQNPEVPALVCSGEQFQVSCDVRNRGTVQAPASVMAVYFSVGNQEIDAADLLLANVNVPAINRNQTVPVTADVTLSQLEETGPYFIIFKMDPENTVREVTENNNGTSREFSLCQPDLTIENQQSDQLLLSRGQTFNVAFDLINQGEIEAPNHTVTYYLAKDQQTLGEDQVIGETSISTINAGETLSVNESLTIPSTTEDGSHFLVFRADSKNDVTEKNEDNNIVFIDVNIQNLPDLSITDALINPQLVAFGQTVSMITTILNNGVEAAGESVMRYYLSSDSLISEGDLVFEQVVNIPELAVGEQVELGASLDIPEEFEEGIYYIIARADDDDVIWENNELNNVSVHEISILSDIPPVITSTDFPEYRIDGLENTIIKIEAEDDVEIADVIFKYKGIRSATWDSTSVNLQGGYYRVSIPGAIFDELGLEYYFEVFDDVGLKAVSDTGFTYIEYPDEGLAFPELSFGKGQNNYQMVAIPLTLAQNGVQAIFEDDLGPYDKTKWRLFTYQNGEIVEFGEGAESPERIETGRGYWLIIRDETELNTGEGRTVRANEEQLYEITLNEGWNQIGNPYNFDFKWSDVLSLNGFPSGISGDIKVFEDGFKSTDVLKRFQGGFVQTNTSITLKIPITKEILPNGRQVSGRQKSAEGWYVGLAIGNGRYQHEINGFGMNELAADGMDQFDETLLPNFGFLSNLALKFNSIQSDSFHFAKDIVSLKDEHVWDVEIENESAHRNVYLSWNDPELADQDKRLVLFNPVDGLQVDMRTNPGIWIDSRRTDKIRIIYGGDEFLKEAMLPASIVLGGGYPNPFNNNTRIPLALPESPVPYEVYLNVYDNLGKSVKTLMNGQYEAGLYEAEWDGSNESGDKVKPGIYFYRLSIANDDNNQSRYGRLVFE